MPAITIPPAARLLLVFALGALMPLGFSPYHLVALPIVALAILMRLGQAQPVRMGYVFGLGWFVTGAWWLAPTVHIYGGLPWYAAALVVCLVGAILAIFPALWMGLSHGLMRRLAYPSAVLLVYPMMIMPVAWLRGHIFTGLPWESLGNLVVDTPALGWLSVVGVYGAACLPVAAASCLWALSCQAHRRAGIAATLIWLLVLGATPNITMPQSPIVHAALVQPNIAQEHKWDANFLASTMHTLTQLSSTQAKQADMIVWPEAAVPFYFENNPIWNSWLQQQMASWHTPVVFGGIKYFPDSKTSQNGLYLFTPSDGFSGFVGKHHLVPFGEYVPSWLPWVHTLVPDIGDFREARDAGVLQLGQHIVGSLICYESIFPEEARARVKAGAQVLVVVTNDAWYGTSPAAWQHLQAARVRAVEEGRFVLRAGNTGVTAVIAPNGRVVQSIPWWTASVLLGKYQWMYRHTLYQKWGDMGILVLWGLGALLLIILQVYRPKWGGSDATQ